MKITAIEKQQKRQHRYSVFIDNKYAFALSDNSLIEVKISVGQEINSEQARAIKKIAQTDNIYNQVLHYLSFRPRSNWEIETYLKRKDCPPLLAKTILNKLSKNGLINDLTFAQAWVENRRLLKPVARRRLISELMAKRIERDIIDQVINEDTTNELEVLSALMQLKRQQPKYQDDLKLMQYLARQGFRYDDIKTAFKST
jgi:regulatory protein